MDYYNYWGKKTLDSDSEDIRFHRLVYHCLDVAAVSNVFLSDSEFLRQRFSRLSGMDEDSLLRSVSYFLAIHDIGKFADSFQNLDSQLLQSLQGRSSSLRYTQRHDELGWNLWTRTVKPVLCEGNVLKESTGQRFSSSSDYLARAVMGHHGLPPRGFDGRLKDHFECPQDLDSVVAFTSDLVALILGDYELAVPSDRSKAKIWSWWLAGLTVLCDWLGSNSNYFPFRGESVDLVCYWDDAREYAQKAVRDSGLSTSRPSSAITLSDLIEFPLHESASNTPLQSLVQKLDIEEGPHLFLLEDVTGSGKTEAAMLLAHRLMRGGHAKGLYFALPTTATANDMYRRFGPVYRRLFASESEPSLILAHTARNLSKEFQKSIPQATASNNSNYDNGELSAESHCNAWLADNGKKALLADVGVGTIDQALLGILTSRHQSLRLLGLIDKVLIVDEIHACDAYMQKLLCALLDAHARSGGSAILLSATLPHHQRQILVDAFARPEHAEPVELRRIDEASYPLFTHYTNGSLEETVVDTHDAAGRTVTVKPIHEPDTVESVLAEALDSGKCAVWIRNTVYDARAAYSTFKGKHSEWDIDLFHARYAMSDRLNIEERISESFGKNSSHEQRRGKLVIATQVIEQSLDLDFDLMVTDLAPIDLIIQRAGRLCRHSRDRQGGRIVGPDQRSKPVLYVFGPMVSQEPSDTWYKSFFPKGSYVYEHHGQLWLTARLLSDKESIHLPEDARLLIEGVYGEAAQEDIPDGLHGLTLAYEGSQGASASMGQGNAIKISQGYCDSSGNRWWDEGHTPTRLGSPSVTVHLARWENETLSPWIKDRKYAWQRSAVSIRTYHISKEGDNSDIPDQIISQCRDELPAKGKWSVLLPLTRIDGSVWRGSVRNGEGCLVDIYYSSKLGLMTKDEYSQSEGKDK